MTRKGYVDEDKVEVCLVLNRELESSKIERRDDKRSGLFHYDSRRRGIAVNIFRMFVSEKFLVNFYNGSIVFEPLWNGQ